MGRPHADDPGAGIGDAHGSGDGDGRHRDHRPDRHGVVLSEADDQHVVGGAERGPWDGASRGRGRGRDVGGRVGGRVSVRSAYAVKSRAGWGGSLWSWHWRSGVFFPFATTIVGLDSAAR